MLPSIKADDRISDALSTVLTTNSPAIQDFLVSHGGPKLLQAAQDDANITLLAGFLYTMLPAPVRFFVKEPTFVAWALQHRAVLVQGLSHALPAAAPTECNGSELQRLPA